MNAEMEWGSEVSSCKNYIYNIWCKWSNQRPCVFVMLNPSVLEGRYKNPTIDNCITIAKDKSCGGMIAVDLFACIAWDENKLLQKKSEISNIIGAENDKYLRSALSKKDAFIIAAWGDVSMGNNNFRKTKEFKERVDYVIAMIRDIAKNKNPKDIKCLKGAQPIRGGQIDHPWWLLDNYNGKSDAEIAEEVRRNYELNKFPL